MQIKVSMRPIDRGSLSEHEAKRCRAMARRQRWEVWEEDILWWSPDRQRWQPQQAESLPRQQRWLIGETEEGLAAALIWHIGQELALPSVRRQALTEERADGLARLSRL